MIGNNSDVEDAGDCYHDAPTQSESAIELGGVSDAQPMGAANTVELDSVNLV